jgi:ABC-type amino acid transport substrate-binding protein
MLASMPGEEPRMMRSRLRLVALVVAAFLAGCQDYYRPAPPPAEIPANALHVGVTSTYPPIIFKQGGEIAGVEADLARLLGARLGRPVHFTEVTWDRQIDTLMAGQTDIIMSGMSVTEARQVRIAFTDPYLEAGLMAAVRREDARQYASRDALLQTIGTVGAIERTTGDVFVQQNFPNARRITLSLASDGALALRRRTIDVFVHDGPSIAWLVSANEAELAGIWQPLNKENLAWGIRRDDPALLAQVNDILGAWKRDGTLTEVLVRWLPYLKKPS